jgi:hypothetical protein
LTKEFGILGQEHFSDSIPVDSTFVFRAYRRLFSLRTSLS